MSAKIQITPIIADYDAKVSSSIREKRILIFTNDTLTRISHLQDYISLLHTSDQLNLPFSSKVPWDLAADTKSALQWTTKDELIVASVLLALDYERLASQVVLEVVSSTTTDPEKLWKVSNNWLKHALTMVKYLVNSKLYNDKLNTTSLNFLHLLTHLFESSIQMSLLMKSNFTSISKIKQNDWNFQIDTLNHVIYLRVCLFIADELSICEQLLTTLPAYKAMLDLVRLQKWYIRIYIAYYTALANYEKDRVGLSIGIVNYIKKSLLQNEDSEEVGKNSKFKRKMITKFTSNSSSSGQTSEKQLIKEITSTKDIKLNSKLTKHLPGNYVVDLTHLVKLINLINLKLLKENDNIKFQPVSNVDDVVAELASQPLGRKIPLSIDDVPDFLKGGPTKGTKDYMGSGSYF